MLSSILNILKTGASLLTNTSPSYVQNKCEQERLSVINHLESKKFFMVSVAVVILLAFFAISTAVLFLLPSQPEVVTGFITLHTKTSEILAIIIAAYVGVQAAVDFKLNSSSSASMSNQSQQIDQNIQQTIQETLTVIHTNQKEEDYEVS